MRSMINSRGLYSFYSSSERYRLFSSLESSMGWNINTDSCFSHANFKD